MRRLGLGTVRISRAALGACTLLAVMTVTPTALAATGAAAPWTIQNSPNATVPGGQLEAISCSAASACTAVGTAVSTSGLSLTLAERWDGTAWQVQSTPDPADNTVFAAGPVLLGVSCPRSTFCEAVGAYTVGTVGISLADGWNGTAWTSQSFPVPPSSTSAVLTGVSCISATFCEAVGSYSNGVGETLAFTARWNGATWHLQSTPNPVGAASVSMRGISCISAKFCEAAGNSLDTGPFAMNWNGTSWQLQTVPALSGVSAVSCVSRTFCEAIGSGGAASWNGSAWSAQTTPSTAFLTALSCATAMSCEAVGSFNNSQGNTVTAAATWNGTSWAAQTTPNPAGASFASLDAVSCSAAAACQAGGDFELSNAAPNLVVLGESWDGSSWQLQPVVSPAAATSNGLSSVACVSQVFCEAVGSYTDASAQTVALAEVWNGATWEIQPTPDPAEAANGFVMSLAGVSCTSVDFCEAVGGTSGGAGAEQWNGTNWVLQTVPGGSLTSVSCTSASFCAATGFDGHVDMWDGSSWSAQVATAGFTSLSSVSCLSPSYCEAVGAGPSGGQAEQWNGSSWTAQVMPTPDGGSSVDPLGVSCSSVTSCETVGWYIDDTFTQVTLAEAWDGTSWTVQPTPNPAASFGAELQGVSCTSPTYCAAVGQYSPSSQSLTVAEVWDGTAWSLRSTPSVAFAGQNVLASVSCTGSQCTAAGVTDDPAQFTATLIETGG